MADRQTSRTRQGTKKRAGQGCKAGTATKNAVRGRNRVLCSGSSGSVDEQPNYSSSAGLSGAPAATTLQPSTSVPSRKRDASQLTASSTRSLAPPKKAQKAGGPSSRTVDQPAAQQATFVTLPSALPKPRCMPTADTVYRCSLAAKQQQPAVSKQMPMPERLTWNQQLTTKGASDVGTIGPRPGSATVSNASRHSMPARTDSGSAPKLGPVLCRKPSKDKAVAPDVIPPVGAVRAPPAQPVASALSRRYINLGTQAGTSVPVALAAAPAPAPVPQPSTKNKHDSRFSKQARTNAPETTAAASVPPPQAPTAGRQQARTSTSGAAAPASMPQLAAASKASRGSAASAPLPQVPMAGRHRTSSSGAAAPAPMPQLAADGKASRGSAKSTSWHPRAQRQANQQNQEQSGAKAPVKGLKLLPGEPALHSSCLDHGCPDQGDSGQASCTRADQSYPKKAKLAEEMICTYRDKASEAANLCEPSSFPPAPYSLDPEQAGSTNDSQSSEDLPEAQHRYRELDTLIRKVLWLRALNKGGRVYADKQLACRDCFMRVCLLAQRQDGQAGPPSMHQASQAIIAYHRMLKELYGPQLVLEPYVLSIDAFQQYQRSGGAELHLFRLLQRRFIVYQPSKAADMDKSQGTSALASPDADSHPSAQSVLPCGSTGPVHGAHHPETASHASDSRKSPGSCSVVDIMGSGAESGTSAATMPARLHAGLPDWDETLLGVWRKLQADTAQQTCDQARNPEDDPTLPSCTLHDGAWSYGLCKTIPAPDHLKVWDVVNSSLENKPGSQSRMYFLDGTFPGQLPAGCQKYADIPGLCCGVDQAVNSMLPGPMRSDRPESLFKHLCVESTGTASFTLFAPIGTACNVTAFHQETKKRRSWNVGTGDFIVQPLSTADNVRKLERIHAAVMGGFKRHGHVLPLEMYLEEGLPLVCYMRNQPYVEMVELPEQSCHFFMSWSNAAAPVPSLKASCNDWHLESELSSAYLLEKLVGSMHRAGVEDGPPPDGAHTWVESPHAMLEPCRIDQSLGAEDPRVNGTWRRPWADECQGQRSTPEELEQQTEKANRSSSVEVLLVRSAEKALDAANGLLKPTAWIPQVLTRDQALNTLQDALPALQDLHIRAAPQGKRGKRHSDEATAHFSQDYMQIVVQEVQQALAAAGRDSATHIAASAPTAATASSTESKAAEPQPSGSGEVLSAAPVNAQAKARRTSTLSHAGPAVQIIGAATGNDDSSTDVDIDGDSRQRSQGHSTSPTVSDVDIIGIPAPQGPLQKAAYNRPELPAQPEPPLSGSQQGPWQLPSSQQQPHSERPQPSQLPSTRTQQLKREAGCCQEEPCSSATASNGLSTGSPSVPTLSAQLPQPPQVLGPLSGKALGISQGRSRSQSVPCSADIANAFGMAGNLACDLQPSESMQPNQASHPSGVAPSQTSNKRSRDAAELATDDETASKQQCYGSSDFCETVRSSQVYSRYMSIKHAAHLLRPLGGPGFRSRQQQVADISTGKAKICQDGQLQALCHAVSALWSEASEQDLLQLGLPALRSHWLLALQLEWVASRYCSDKDGLEKLGQARHHRLRVEALHDMACSQLFQTHVKDWGAKAM